MVGDFPGVFRVAKLRNVTVTTWLGEPLNHESATHLGELTSALIAEANGTRLSSIHLVERNMKLPDGPGRQQLANVVRASADSMGCVAVVVQADGFFASAIRGLITGLRVLAPRSFDVRVDASIAELLEWFPLEHQRRTGVEVDAKDVERLLALGHSWNLEEGGSTVA